MWNNISIIIIVIIIIIIIITFIIINKRGSYVKCNEIGVAWHYSTGERVSWLKIIIIIIVIIIILITVSWYAIRSRNR